MRAAISGAGARGTRFDAFSPKKSVNKNSIRGSSGLTRLKNNRLKSLQKLAVKLLVRSPGLLYRSGPDVGSALSIALCSLRSRRDPEIVHENSRRLRTRL